MPGTANLADDDTVRPHAERIAEEVTDGHFAVAVEMGRPRLEASDMRQRQPQLGSVLDRQDALTRRSIVFRWTAVTAQATTLGYGA